MPSDHSSLLPVQSPAGAVLALQPVVGLGHVSHAAGGRIVLELLTGAMRHQTEQHLLHHRTGVVEVAVGLAAGSVHDVVALALAGIEPVVLEQMLAGDLYRPASGLSGASRGGLDLIVGSTQCRRDVSGKERDNREAVRSKLGATTTAAAATLWKAAGSARHATGTSGRRASAGLRASETAHGCSATALRRPAAAHGPGSPSAAAAGDLPGPAHQRKKLVLAAALVVGHVAVVVVRNDHAAVEIGEDHALRALEDRAVPDPRHVEITPGRIGLQAALIPNHRDGAAPANRGMFETRLQLHRSDVGVELVADIQIGLDGRRSARVDRVPEQIHRVRALVAHLADPEVPVHIPRQAVVACAGRGEVLRAVGMHGRRSDPLVVVEVGGRLAFAKGIAGPGELAAVPPMDDLQIADGPVEDEFPHALEVWKGVTLGAVLRGQLGLVLEIVGADRARFLHGDAQRLLAVDVHAAVQRPVGDEGVMVVRGANDHALDVLLVQALPPVPIGLGLREYLEAFGQAVLVHVAESHHVLVRQHVVVRGSPPPHAHEGDVQLVAWSVLPSERAALEDCQSDAGGSGLEQISTLHDAFLLSSRTMPVCERVARRRRSRKPASNTRSGRPPAWDCTRARRSRYSSTPRSLWQCSGTSIPGHRRAGSVREPRPYENA